MQCEAEIYKSLSVIPFGMLLFCLVFSIFCSWFLSLVDATIWSQTNTIFRIHPFFFSYHFLVALNFFCSHLDGMPNFTEVQAITWMQTKEKKKSVLTEVRPGVQHTDVQSELVNVDFWAVNLFISYNKSSCNEVDITGISINSAQQKPYSSKQVPVFHSG